MSSLDIRHLSGVVVSLFWSVIFIVSALILEAPFGFLPLIVGFIYLWLLHRKFDKWEDEKRNQEIKSRLSK